MEVKGVVEAATSTSSSTSTSTSTKSMPATAPSPSKSTAATNPSSKTAAVTETKTKIDEILSKISRWQSIHSKFESTIPFVCVTYAQTLDGMIAVSNTNKNEEGDKDKEKTTAMAMAMEGSAKSSSSNLALSCKESFQLTHALRSIHDGILIGGNTLFTDNPRLNNRLWPTNDNSNNDSRAAPNHYNQPVPIIMDTHLNGVMKMIKSKMTIRSVSSHDKIIICCSEDAYKTFNDEVQSTYPCNTIHLCPCTLNEQTIEMGSKNDSGNINNSNDLVLKGGGLNIQNVLNNLRIEHGIQSLMVEGGSSILSSFLSQAKANDMVDCVCVTIVPKLIGGRNGLLALGGCDLLQQQGQTQQDSNDGNGLKGLEFDPSMVTWSTIGSDCIFLASCVSNN